ncbi:TetR/AcrR family transcriptional regulator [Pseudoroseicyclus aestuarii]|uniref:TetR family transcriptional regulator n=1 Tax=Pseudoroseicyclus aestuarii TaxID=1795041 RepID=A0A318SVD8_9RHOB|nr:TetR/AcrR family transcriptional regulator [Pseudoroseicyclus aestuarii]PYE84286.1 TetR family transcriptional regulator [Pseudoroseicyclus aestuarii]
MTTETQAIRKGRKFDQVLAGACDVFMCEGFEGASVDEIARAAGVSKATLYSYFPDKRLLFLEVIKAQAARQAAISATRIDPNLPLPEFLRSVARFNIDFATSEAGLRLFRIFVAESERFPDIGKAFWETAHLRPRDKLAAALRRCVEAGELQIDDVDLAAMQFHDLCKTDLVARALFNIDAEFTEAEIARVADGAVEMFLARYGVRQGAPA